MDAVERIKNALDTRKPLDHMAVNDIRKVVWMAQKFRDAERKLPIDKLLSGEMVAVPVEPTDEMIKAAVETPGMEQVESAVVLAAVHGHEITEIDPFPLSQAWNAMLKQAKADYAGK